MKRIIIFTFTFFLLVFLSIQKRIRETVEEPLEAEKHEEKEGVEEDERYDQPFKFQEYLNGIKIRYGKTRSEYPSSYQFLEHKTAMLQSARRKSSSLARMQSNNGVLEWKERGPGNVPGRTRALLVDPDDATHKTWYAGSVSGGIWKTADGGNTWIWLTATLPNLATTSLAMADSNHDVIYAGTGEGFGNLDGVSGHGVFKSIDRGQNWSLLNATVDFGDINRLIIDPATEAKVVVASNKGIYRTIDGGTVWAQTFTGVVQDIDATPGNFSIQYGGEYRTGVLKSIDGGQAWQLSNAGMNSNGRVEIAVSPVDPNRIFASSEGTMSGNNSDLYVSDDAGSSWSVVDLNLSNKTVDFLSAAGGTIVQGGYDNTIVCDPYDRAVVYVGGVGIYQVKVGAGSTFINTWVVDESSTQSFLLMEQFSNVMYASGKLNVGPSNSQVTVEVRFGPGMKQKAHRFTVPTGSTSGVPDNSYSYMDYVDVNFEVWDVTNNRQLMVSFRDQNKNGAFNLLPQNFSTTDALNNSREYVFVQGITYSNTEDPTIAKAGGQQTNLLYNIFPALAAGHSPWTGTETGTLKISFLNLTKLNATTVSVSDPYKDYDGKNNALLIHPDHHNLVAIPIDNNAKTYQLLNSNDGGVYISGVSISPGTTQGSWTAVGRGFNTGQFYGADKRPGADEYIGGLQDNGTQKSPVGVSASSTSAYVNVIGGDGFEVVWNNNDDEKIIGGFYGDNFRRSTDGGTTWQAAINGLLLSNGNPDPNEFPFISRLAVSKNNPDVLFTPGKSGVYKSTNFGGLWKLTAIPGNFGLASYLDADVSAANANVVWAGAGMSSSMNVFVSTDNGTTFNATTNYTGATLGVLTKLATHPIEPNTAYALFSFAHSPKILRTTNLGQTWQDISGFVSGNTSANGFPDVAVYSLYVRPDNPNIIWAGTEIGIVESLDNGVSWSMLTDFPAVSVWDMKGQDDQVVIATHGRGIWTAKIGAQQIAIQNPVITAYGTSPQSKFAMQIHLPQVYDSTQIVVNAIPVGSISTNSIGDYIIKLSNVAPGAITLNIVGFKNGTPAYSSLINARQIGLLNYKINYYNYFSDGQDFLLTGLFVAPLAGANHPTLQTPHPYTGATSINALLRQPIIISNTLPFFYYSDVAIVQNGPASAVFGQPEFKDYVVVEATRDGLTWVPLAQGYNSLADPNWLTAFNGTKPGTQSMEVHHSVNLTNTLAVGDTVLFRFRLSADNDGVTAWGWSVNELTIQQAPTGLEPVVATLEAEVFPNPAKGQFFVKYSLPAPSPVTINLIDITGRIVGSYPLGNKNAGEYTQEITQELSPGSYFVQVQAGKGQRVKKVILKN